MEDSAVSVLAKLDQLLPAHLAQRVRAVHESMASLLGPARADPVEASHLVLLAQACSRRERVRFDYTDKTGRPTRRLVEPLQVVRAGARWYLAARDVDRSDWRTFRLDRVRDPELVGTRFDFTDPPDPLELVTAGFASMPFPFTARIRLPVPLDEAVKLIPRTVAVFEARDGATVVEVGSGSMARMVAYLSGLRPPCQVLDPPELRHALAAHAREVADANGTAGPSASDGPVRPGGWPGDRAATV
jgi:predicted DNA-binding transcriptional regulator YafY